MTLQVLAEKGQANTEVARTLGVTEGTVRYHKRRAAESAVDGRAGKERVADDYAGVIEHWFQHHEESEPKRPVNVRELHEHLVEQHDYPGAYKSTLRFVRAHYPRPRMRTYRRVETVPGAQTQTDWGEFPRVDVGEGPEPLHAFVMTLSHSRKPAVVWSRSADTTAWLWCHNRAYERLAGVAAVNRIDNVKTAIARGAGAWGEIGEAYRAYARAVGFHVDACPPRAGNAKGKVEAKVHLARLRVTPRDENFDGLEHLQAWSDQRLDRWARKAMCPMTGLSVHDSWQQELEVLAPLPELPEPFDVAVTRRVHKDCMVWFENRQYPVPFAYAGQLVEVRGCGDAVQILADGRVLRTHERRGLARIIVDPSCYEGEATDRVLPPPPLGKMGRRLQELWDMPAEARPLDLYAALAEVAR